MPETALLVPIAEIFGVSVDELLKGKRAEEISFGEPDGEPDDGHIDVNKYLFKSGRKGEKNKTLSERMFDAVSCSVFFAGCAVYLLLDFVWGLWHPYWVIIPTCALFCGILGIISDLCNPRKRRKKIDKGENPYVGAVCGIVMLSCIIIYLWIGALLSLWHPYWIIVAGGAVFCGILGCFSGAFIDGKK